MPDKSPAANLKPVRPVRVSILEVASMATTALWNNKLRTGLTMLGMIIGIGSVVAISSVGQGVQKATEQQIQALGTDVLQVSAGAARSGNVQLAMGSNTTLTWEDAKAIQDHAVSAQAVSAYLQRQAQVVYGNQNYATTVMGTDLNYPVTRNTHPAYGRYFTTEELDSQAQVVVLGTTVLKQLFGSSPDAANQAIGQSIRIQGESYEVIGVMESKGSQGPMDRDDMVYLPLTNMSARMVGNNALAGVAVNGIYVKTANQTEMASAQFQITNLLRLRHDIQPPQADDFRITSQAEIIQTFTTVLGLLTTMVAAIASISLIVGGIGIANIMLVSVVERTREIGVRKALGATQYAILSQFLVEAVLISTTGGMIGLATGTVIAFGAATVFSFPFILSAEAIAAGVGLSFTVGVLAGVIPARNAAKLDPITALRSE
jgi:putative ABC transport system permease protein